jgi:hypothetical protein
MPPRNETRSSVPPSGTTETKSRTEPGGALAQARHAEMTGTAVRGHLAIDADAIIGDAKRKVRPVGQLDVHSAAL